MTVLEIILLCGVLLSASTTAVMVWYVRILMKKYAEVLNFWNNSFDKIEEFTTHVETVYQMDRYTGEPTLEELMNHGERLLTDLSGIPFLVENLSSDATEQQEEGNQVG